MYKRRPGILAAVIAALACLVPAQVAAISQSEEAPPNLAPLEAVANSWLKRPELQHSLVGLEVLHIPSGHVLFSFNGRRRFVPASTVKVFTTACAMDQLGAGFRFKTSLKAYGDIDGTRLNGSLYIEPSQDPSLKTAELKQLLANVPGKNLKTIEGKVDVLPMTGGGDRFATAWLGEDWGQNWMPVSCDLVLDDNIARRDPARGYPLVAHSATAEQNALVNSLLRSPFGPSWVCFNPIKQQVEFWHPEGPLVGGQIVGNPQVYNAAAARSMLRAMGVKIKEKMMPPSVLEKAPTLLGEHSSKPLSELVRHCLKESDNLYAQQLLRTLGSMSPVNKLVDKATLEERGLARVNSWLHSIGVPPGDTVLWDGCGLSRKNCVTPHSLNLVHRHMALSQQSNYLDVMPVDGAPGATTGTFRYKTGAMDSVRAISGVVVTAAGEPLAVTVMVNAHTPSVRDIRGSIGRLIDHLQTLGSLRFDTQPAVPPAMAHPVHKAPAPAIRKPVHPPARMLQRKRSTSSRSKR